jgi:hypothetical protein
MRSSLRDSTATNADLLLPSYTASDLPPLPTSAPLKMAALLKVYTRSFEKSPYLTLCIANGLLMSIGDVSAQLLPIAVRILLPTLFFWGRGR